MKKTLNNFFTVTDRINFRDVTAVIKVDTSIQDCDMLEIVSVRDDISELTLTEDQEYQIKQTFIREYGKQYNEILNQHSERVEEIKNLRAA